MDMWPHDDFALCKQTLVLRFLYGTIRQAPYDTLHTVSVKLSTLCVRGLGIRLGIWILPLLTGATERHFGLARWRATLWTPVPLDAVCGTARLWLLDGSLLTCSLQGPGTKRVKR